jgi:hypothetical protein
MKTLNSTIAPLGQAFTLVLSLSWAGCGSGPLEESAARRKTSAADRPMRTGGTAPRDQVAGSSRSAPLEPPSTRPNTKEGCDTCQGLWGAHGAEDIESCICKTNDEGRECTDGDDCQGECLVDANAEFHVMDQADPPRGYYTGRCAGFDTTFGCFLHIPNGIQGSLPLTADEAGPFICVD